MRLSANVPDSPFEHWKVPERVAPASWMPASRSQEIRNTVDVVRALRIVPDTLPVTLPESPAPLGVPLEKEPLTRLPTWTSVSRSVTSAAPGGATKRWVP